MSPREVLVTRAAKLPEPRVFAIIVDDEDKDDEVPGTSTYDTWDEARVAFVNLGSSIARQGSIRIFQARYDVDGEVEVVGPPLLDVRVKDGLPVLAVHLTAVRSDVDRAVARFGSRWEDGQAVRDATLDERARLRTPRADGHLQRGRAGRPDKRVPCRGPDKCPRCAIYRLTLAVFREEHPRERGEDPARWLARTREAFALEQPELAS